MVGEGRPKSGPTLEPLRELVIFSSYGELRTKLVEWMNDPKHETDVVQLTVVRLPTGNRPQNEYTVQNPTHQIIVTRRAVPKAHKIDAPDEPTDLWPLPVFELWWKKHFSDIVLPSAAFKIHAIARKTAQAPAPAQAPQAPSRSAAPPPAAAPTIPEPDIPEAVPAPPAPQEEQDTHAFANLRNLQDGLLKAMEEVVGPTGLNARLEIVYADQSGERSLILDIAKPNARAQRVVCVRPDRSSFGLFGRGPEVEKNIRALLPAGSQIRRFVVKR